MIFRNKNHDVEKLKVNLIHNVTVSEKRSSFAQSDAHHSHFCFMQPIINFRINGFIHSISEVRSIRFCDQYAFINHRHRKSPSPMRPSTFIFVIYTQIPEFLFYIGTLRSTRNNSHPAYFMQTLTLFYFLFQILPIRVIRKHYTHKLTVVKGFRLLRTHNQSEYILGNHQKDTGKKTLLTWPSVLCLW